MYQAVLVLGIARNFFYSPTEGYISEIYVLDTDNTVPVNSSSYIVTAVISVLMLSIFNLLPVLLLALYPLNFFKRVLSKCRRDGFFLTFFVERFHSCYRDGLDGGKDMRSFSGLYFLLRILVVAGVSDVLYNLNFESWFARGTLLSITAIAISLCRPYKKLYMNTSDTLLLSHIALICHILSSNTENMLFVPFMQTLILSPFAIFTVYVLFRIVRGIHRSSLVQRLFQCCLKAESTPHTQELNRNAITQYGAI